METEQPEHAAPQPMASDSVKDLAGALAKAQAAITTAATDRENPHFRSRYASLASVWDACRQPLAANGLSIVQTIEPHRAGVLLVTTLLHASGQWMRSRLFLLPTKMDAQGYGSALTYARRYALAAMVGVAVADEDDDATEATKPGNGKAAEPVRPQATTARTATLQKEAQRSERAWTVTSVAPPVEGTHLGRGVIERVETKDDPSGAGKWRLFKVEILDEENHRDRYSTFDRKTGELAQEAVHQAVEFRWQPGKPISGKPTRDLIEIVSVDFDLPEPVEIGDEREPGDD